MRFLTPLEYTYKKKYLYGSTWISRKQTAYNTGNVSAPIQNRKKLLKLYSDPDKGIPFSITQGPSSLLVKEDDLVT
jgi:hypothetical protein